MNSSKGIIDKIVSTNQELIDRNISEANAKAETIISEAEAERDKTLVACRGGSEALFEETVRRRLSVANLDAKREIMNAKRAVADRVFGEAVNACAALPDDRYLSVIEGMLRANACDGDCVIISEADKGRITDSFIAKVAKKMGIKLRLSDDFGSFKGGIVLSGDSYDKNLTLEVEIAEIRESSEAEYLSKLFKE